MLPLGAALFGVLGAATVLAAVRAPFSQAIRADGPTARMLWAAFFVALAGRVALAVEHLAVTGITLGVLAATGNIDGLMSELVAGSAPMLLAGYGLLILVWSRLDWDGAERAGWRLGSAPVFILFLAAGWWLGWVARLPLDLATDFLNFTDAQRAHAAAYLVSIPVSILGTLVGFGAAAGCVIASRTRLASLLTEAGRGRIRRAIVLAAAVGLLADGVVWLTEQLYTLLPEMGTPAARSLTVLALVVACTVAFGAARAVRPAAIARAGYVPGAGWWTLLALTLAAYFTWPVELAGRFVALPQLAGTKPLAGLVLAVAFGGVLLLATVWYPPAPRGDSTPPDAYRDDPT